MIRTAAAAGLLGAALLLAACADGALETDAVKAKECAAVAAYVRTGDRLQPGGFIDPVLKGTPTLWTHAFDEYIPRPSYRYLGRKWPGLGPWLQTRRDMWLRDVLIAEAHRRSARALSPNDCGARFKAAGLPLDPGLEARTRLVRAGASVAVIRANRPILMPRGLSGFGASTHACYPSRDKAKPFQTYSGGDMGIVRWDGKQWADIWSYSVFADLVKRPPVDACE